MTHNILITGSLGFIGSCLTKLLVNTTNYNIVMLDTKTYAADVRRLEDIKNKIDLNNRLYIVDICDKKLVERIIQEHNIDIIVNMAANTHVDNAIKDSEPFIHSNYIGVWNLLEIIKDNKEKGKDIKMVQISTDECYGSILEGSFKETDRLNPGNPYSSSKAGADLLCLAYKNTFDLDVIITRSSNNYGQGQHLEKYIPRMIKLAIEGKDLEIFGSGHNIRDWLYVSDNSNAIQIVIDKGIKGEIYNIAGNNEMTNNHVAELIADRFGVGIKYIEDRKGHDYRYSIDYTKIKEELGWKPTTKFEDGLEKTIDWYIKEEHRKDLEATIV